MINIFRKVRKKLADENKFFKYSRYAIGEILLIVIGIFFALQLQNWNENRKQEEQFKITIEQIYNVLNNESELYLTVINPLEDRVGLTNYLLNNLDSIPLVDLPYSVYWNTVKPFNRNSEIQNHISNLNYNPNNKQQNNITSQISKYANGFKSRDMIISDDLKTALFKQNIPYPNINPSDFFDESDSTYYSNDELLRLQKFTKTDEFKTLIKNIKSQSQIDLIFAKNRYQDCISLINLILNYYPNVKLLFQDVGIIGTSINGYDDVGAISTPMLETDFGNNIWEIEMYLKVGTVKFRCRDSWVQNWGGNTFPNGNTDFNSGDDIPVTEDGNYHIILNLSANTYEFIKLEEDD